MPTPTNNAHLSQRLDYVVETVDRIAGVVDCTDGRLDSFEKTYIEKNTKLTLTVDDHAKRIDTLEKVVKALSDAVTPLIYANKILVWVAGLVGASVIALIWALIVGQVQLVFP